jgi:ankyrin repeat protein
MWALAATDERDLSLQVVESLLDADADVNAADGSGRTPLMVLMHTSQGLGGVATPETIAKLLIGKGANVNAADHSGKTALAWATGKESMRRLLKRAGATK